MNGPVPRITTTRKLEVVGSAVPAELLQQFVDGLAPRTAVRVTAHAAMDVRDQSTITLTAEVELPSRGTR